MISQRLKDFSAIVASAVPTSYHYFRSQKTYPCAIWQEDSAELFRADNQADEIRMSGTLDYFTREEFDTAIDDLISAFTGNGVHWSIESIQFEEETNLIHYEFGWRY